jgi:carbonic anhydrase
MKHASAVFALVCATTLPLAQAADPAAPHWSYEGAAGPAGWGKEFPTCGLGKAQSPIDIKGPFQKATQAIQPDYKAGALKVVNNGHTIQVNVDPGSKLRIDQESYDLLQFHFHRPSEEKINGKPMAMVAHFVHRSAAGKLAVVGVLLNEGRENPTLKAVWAAAPKAEGPEVTVPGAKLDAAALLPKSLSYYRFEGSLTTPPCSEGVTFYILKSPVPMAKAQIDAFPFRMNARPVQPLNGRRVAAN